MPNLLPLLHMGAKISVSVKGCEEPATIHYDRAGVYVVYLPALGAPIAVGNYHEAEELLAALDWEPFHK